MGSTPRRENKENEREGTIAGGHGSERDMVVLRSDEPPRELKGIAVVSILSGKI